MIFILKVQIKIIPQHCPARSIRKIIIPQHRQASLAEKNYTTASPSWPGRFFLYHSSEPGRQHAPLRRYLPTSTIHTNTVLPKNYTTATGKKIYHGSGLGSSEKKYTTALPGWPGRKTIIPQLWLPAGCLSCCGIIYFSAKNHTGIKFGLEPDALIAARVGPKYVHIHIHLLAGVCHCRCL